MRSIEACKIQSDEKRGVRFEGGGKEKENGGIPNGERMGLGWLGGGPFERKGRGKEEERK